MIFITVGTQLPFDRLIDVLDNILGCDVECIAQVGLGGAVSKKMSCYETISPDEFEVYCKRSSLIISHAGMGSIITALSLKKPIIIFPRVAGLGEHRNDHQLATAKSFSNTPGVYPAFSNAELADLLSNKEALIPGGLARSREYESLLTNIRAMI